MKQENHLARPVIYDYGSPAAFLTDLLNHYKRTGSFSLRQRTAKVGNCSQGLVSQILQGKRRLTRDNLLSISLIFKLAQYEQEYLDKKLAAKSFKIEEPEKKTRIARNHLLSDWLNPYVKDLVNLNGFRLDPETLFFMLQGLAPAEKIKRSVEFLLREGFWRKTPTQKTVLEETAVTTTSEIPNEKIRGFHAKALEIALRGLKTLPFEQRKASTVLLSVDEENLEELRGIMDAFQNQLLEFIEKHPTGSHKLVQITTHLTPVGRSK